MAATRTQYRLVQAIPLIPVGIAFIFSFWMTDTPRWLASQDRYSEAIAALARLRGSDSSDVTVREEFEAIEAQRREKVADLAGTSLKNVIKEIATVPTYRSRFLLVMFMQTVAQWSGGNGITYYIPQIVSTSTSIIPLGPALADLCSREIVPVRGHQRREQLAHLFWSLWHCQAGLHHGIRLGSDRHHWSKTLLPRWTVLSAGCAHLHGCVHVPPTCRRRQ